MMNRAKVLINPSPFESFSLVIAESWLSGTPTLVNAACSVLEGQSRRANAGLWYNNYEEFASMLTVMLENETLREEMAKNGRKYILSNYTWPIVEEKYKRIAEKVAKK
jgi:glycosyltransferase involved in cell wall biosynthesis